MLRRVVPPALLLALGLVSGVLVARLPPDLGTTVVTRRHHGADPLLSAVLLRFGVDSLLHHPSRYFQPPILFPDPNPLRGTEPLVAEALLAVPFRLALGDRPTAVYTWVKIVTLALLTLGTGLMLKELGVRLSLCLLGGGLTVLVSTTVVFADRLQAVSLQWLPLSVLFALRYWRSGRPTQAAAFAVCLFLTVQASLYTTVMLLAVAPFLAPLLIVLRGEANARSRATGLALGAAAAAALCLLILRPYVTDRADVAAYSTAAYASEKSWNPASLTDPLTSPPEYGLPGWRLGPASSWDGLYPGTGFVLLLVGLAALGLADAVRSRKRPHDAGPLPPSHRASGRLLALLLAGLAGAVTLAALTGAGGGARFAAGAFLWSALATWWVRLALWPKPATGETGLGLAASAAGLAAFVFLLLSLGSPIGLHTYGNPASRGDLRPSLVAAGAAAGDEGAQALPLPAGWAAVVAATLALELRLRGRPRALGPALAAVVLLVALAERVQADTRKAFAPPPPEPYELLRLSDRSGGSSSFRSTSGAGSPPSTACSGSRRTGGPSPPAGRGWTLPGTRRPGRCGTSSRRKRACSCCAPGASTACSTRGPATSRRGPRASFSAGGEPMPGSRDGNGACSTCSPEAIGTVSVRSPHPTPGRGRGREAPDAGAAAPAVDGSVETAGEITGPEGLLLVAPGDVSAVELDYGRGRFGRVPSSLRVLGLVGDEWLDLTEEPTGAHLRARAANQLLTQRAARLVVRLRPGRVSKLRLVSDDVPWDLPEVRVRIPAGGLTVPR